MLKPKTTSVKMAKQEEAWQEILTIEIMGAMSRKAQPQLLVLANIVKCL